MVRSMMNLTTLLLSFWDYALVTATRILNMVPTKKVDNTPYELWYGKVPNLSYLKVWGCEALVKRDALDKLQQRSVKCIFVGYSKETMGYYFYFPSKNKIVVARYVEFLEKNLLSQEISRRAEEFEEIQDDDTSPSENTSEIHMEVEEVEEHSLGNLNEPANYKATILDLESDKWLDAMNAKMQSMKDNQVWWMVDLPPNCKTVGRKWIFKKKLTWMALYTPIKLNKRFDEEIKRFGFAQNLDEPYVYQKASGSNVTFLILYVDDIIIMGNHIPSLQSVKSYLGKCFAMKDLGEATFILGIKIYRDRTKRLIGLSQSGYMDKILKRFRMDTSKRGYIPMQEKLDLNKTHGASTPEENLGELHWTSVKTILKYLRNTKDMFLVYGGNPKAELRVDCYCDVGFETDRDDTKSQTGYIFVLNGGTVDWKSSK
ncbi:retrotransposon protein, putative, ty1-copia subclass [Tanacetum coccineum]